MTSPRPVDQSSSDHRSDIGLERRLITYAVSGAVITAIVGYGALVVLLSRINTRVVKALEHVQAFTERLER